MEHLYWFILVSWIIAILFSRYKGTTTLYIGLILFSIAVFLELVSLTNLAEIIMRVSFVGLAIGFVQVTQEYRSGID